MTATQHNAKPVEPSRTDELTTSAMPTVGAPNIKGLGDCGTLLKIEALKDVATTLPSRSSIRALWQLSGEAANSMGLGRLEASIYITATAIGSVALPFMVAAEWFSTGKLGINQFGAVISLIAGGTFAFCEISSRIARRFGGDETAAKEVQILGRTAAPLGFILPVLYEFLGHSVQLFPYTSEILKEAHGITELATAFIQDLSSNFGVVLFAGAGAFTTAKYLFHRVFRS